MDLSWRIILQKFTRYRVFQINLDKTDDNFIIFQITLKSSLIYNVVKFRLTNMKIVKETLEKFQV